jgi:hypothetical protein
MNRQAPLRPVWCRAPLFHAQRNLFDIPRAMNPISVAIKRVYAAARDIEGCFLKGGDHRHGSAVAEF